MKIYILPIPSKLQPNAQSLSYPQHNNDYGVEQDFYKYMKNESDLIADTADKADWHYLPVFWTRWHINHDYAKLGVAELQEEVDKVILDGSKTFTLCQYDDGPVVNLGKTVQFLSSRRTEEGTDIPLLCASHKKPFIRPSKKHKASFVGRLFTHPLREEMAEYLGSRKDIYISDAHESTKFYVKKILSSYVTLCPRGYGGSSFRFFEAMQLAVTPLLIGDIDTRPFKKWINWDEISLCAKSAKEASDMLDAFSLDELIGMGKQAKIVYEEHLTFHKWCPYILEELKEFK